MLRVAWISLAIILSLAVAMLSAWAALAMWYRLPVAEARKGVACGLFILFGLATVIALFSRFRIRAFVLFVAVFGAVLVWWSTIKPSDHADWAPDVARQVTGTRDGNLLTLTNVRDFEWRSDTDFTERWTTRTYDLAGFERLDLFMSYWAGPKMAHVIMSFGFEGGDYLAWSIEVRRRKGGEFSPLADLFKSNPLVIIAADERDVVGVRSNVREEDVQIYRLKGIAGRGPNAPARICRRRQCAFDNSGILQFHHDELYDDHRQDDAGGRRRGSLSTGASSSTAIFPTMRIHGARSTPGCRYQN